MRRIQDERFVCLYGLDTEEYPELAYIEDEIKHSPKYDNGIVNWVVGEMKRSGVCKDYADRVGEYNQPSYMQKMWSNDDKYLMYFDGMGTVEIWGDEYHVSDSRRIKDSEGSWDLWLYDVWGNEEDGWEVNNRIEVARGLSIPDDETDESDYAILSALIQYGIVDSDASLSDIGINYEEGWISIDDATGMPLCEFENSDY